MAKSKYHLIHGRMYACLHHHVFNMPNQELASSHLFKAIKKAGVHGHSYDVAVAHKEWGEVILEEDMAEYHQRQSKTM